MSARGTGLDMGSIGRTLLLFGAALMVAGVLFMFGERFGLGKLPGDFLFRKKNTTIYFPLATSIVLSLVLTLLVNFVLRRK